MAPPGEDDQVRQLEVAGIPLSLVDLPGSTALDVVGSEIGHGPYDFTDIDFQPGDVVVDIGAHVGTVSVWLAKAYPFLRIYSYEPIPPVYERLAHNLVRNDVANVTAFNRAVTGDGRDLELVVHLASNTGGGTAQVASLDLPGHDRHQVDSTTLDDIFEEHGIERLKLLKIDCEGSEYEVLLTSQRLGRIDHVRGEFHENRMLQERGYSAEALERHVAHWVGEGRVRYLSCHMAE